MRPPGASPELADEMPIVLVEAIGRCPIGIMAFPLRPVVVGVVVVGVLVVLLVVVGGPADGDVLRRVVHGERLGVVVDLVDVHVVETLLGGPDPVPKYPRRT